MYQLLLLGYFHLFAAPLVSSYVYVSSSRPSSIHLSYVIYIECILNSASTSIFCRQLYVGKAY